MLRPKHKEKKERDAAKSEKEIATWCNLILLLFATANFMLAAWMRRLVRLLRKGRYGIHAQGTLNRR